MKLSHVKREAIVATNVELNPVEQHVLTTLRTQITELLPEDYQDEAKYKAASYKDERYDQLVNALLKAGAFLDKITDGIIDLETAEDNLFSVSRGDDAVEMVQEHDWQADEVVH